MLGVGRETAAETVPDYYWIAFDAIDQLPNVEQWVVEHDGRLIGCFQLCFLPGLSLRGGLRAQIESVRVASGQRGHGFGARIMAWAVERARKKGCVLVQLTTNKERQDAHRFYERLGFRATHEGMKLKLVRDTQI